MASFNDSSAGPTFKTLSAALASMNLNPRGTGYILVGARTYEADGDVFDIDGPDLHVRISDRSDEKYSSEYLCSHCKGITAPALASPTGYLHVASWERLLESSAGHEKCPLCTRMRFMTENPSVRNKLTELKKQGASAAAVRLKLLK